MTTKLFRLVITDAQRETIQNSLTIAINQYDASIERVKALNGSTELTGVDWALVEQIGKQRRETQALLGFFLPIGPKPRKSSRAARAKPKRKTKR